MSIFWNKYNELCKIYQKSPNKVAKETGISSAAVTRWKNGAQPNSSAIRKLANYFGVKAGAFFDEESGGNVSTVPLLGRISCGLPLLAVEEKDESYPVPTGVTADFCLCAKGDSMTGARIYDGDIVFIRTAQSVENGTISAVIINDEATLKRVYWYPKENKLLLIAENPKYEPLVISGAELDNVRIIGKAVGLYAKL